MNVKVLRKIGARRNLLLRYRQVMEEFDKYDCRDIPIAVIHRRYIYPKFHISRDTLYKIFNTDIEGELSQLEEMQDIDKQMRLF